MPFADLGTHRISYELLGGGDAPPLLLVMGMGFSARAWGTLPERFARARRVVVVDNRGTGLSTAPAAPFRIADLADDAVSALDGAGVAAAHVFGISMGGMVALELAARRPARVRSLVLGATFGGWRPSRKAGPGTLLALVAGSLLSRTGRHGLLGRALVSPAALRDDASRFAAWMENLGRGGPLPAAFQALAVARFDATRTLGTLRVPTLVLAGDADRIVPVENARRLARAIPGARLHVLAGAGHAFPFERFEETARAVELFVEEVDRGGGAVGPEPEGSRPTPVRRR